jgi:hypothetical protein
LVTVETLLTTFFLATGLETLDLEAIEALDRDLFIIRGEFITVFLSRDTL